MFTLTWHNYWEHTNNGCAKLSLWKLETHCCNVCAVPESQRLNQLYFWLFRLPVYSCRKWKKFKKSILCFWTYHTWKQVEVRSLFKSFLYRHFWCKQIFKRPWQPTSPFRFVLWVMVSTGPQRFLSNLKHFCLCQLWDFCLSSSQWFINHNLVIFRVWGCLQMLQMLVNQYTVKCAKTWMSNGSLVSMLNLLWPIIGPAVAFRLCRH